MLACRVEWTPCTYFVVHMSPKHDQTNRRHLKRLTDVARAACGIYTQLQNQTIARNLAKRNTSTHVFHGICDTLPEAASGAFEAVPVTSSCVTSSCDFIVWCHDHVICRRVRVERQQVWSGRDQNTRRSKTQEEKTETANRGTKQTVRKLSR